MRFDKALETAKIAAVAAGDFLENNFDPQIDSEYGKDIKLSYDKKSEKIIIDILKETGIPILSEECGEIEGSLMGLKWIVDPLDGTANYWKGAKDLSCVSIALWKDKEPILGVVNRYHVNELFSGIVGEGAWLNDVLIHVSNTKDIGSAFFITGFPVNRDYGSDSLYEFVSNVQRFKKVRMLGAAAIMGSFVAAGRADAYHEKQIMLWDIAASSAIVKAAGGYIDVKLLKDYQTDCHLFANEDLYRTYKNI